MRDSRLFSAGGLLGGLRSYGHLPWLSFLVIDQTIRSFA